jgi:hypothetical protein
MTGTITRDVAADTSTDGSTSPEGLFVALDRMHAAYGSLHDLCSQLAESEMTWTEEVRVALANKLAGSCLDAMALAGAALSGKFSPDGRVLAAYRQFIKAIADMQTLDDEFSSNSKKGNRLRERYDDVDDYRADLSDARLCSEFGNLESVISDARKLINDPDLQPAPPTDELAVIRAAVKAHDDALNDENQDGGPQVPTGDDYNDIFSIVMRPNEAPVTAMPIDHPAIKLWQIQQIIEKGCSCDKGCRTAPDGSCGCRSEAADILGLFGFEVPDLDALEDSEVLGICSTSGMLVQWNADEKSTYVSETLDEFRIANLREHELPRVGISVAAWKAATAG